MVRCRLRPKLILYAIVVNAILFVLFNILELDKGVSLPELSVNETKNFIQKLVPKRKRVLTFEIGRPKPEGRMPTCRFTQSEGLQLLAENYLYPGDNVPDKSCPKDTQTICTLSGSLGSVLVSCEQNPCGETVKVGFLNRATGNIEWEVVTSIKLENYIRNIELKSINSICPFFFLKCGGESPGGFTQLLSIPLALSSNTSKQSLDKKNINVNIVFLDGVSRRHFYRSLPNTVEAFRGINLNPKSTSNVLDFELYQALIAKRKETVRGVITGKQHNLSKHAVAKPLLSRFRDAGYQTLWQEDLCWNLGLGFVHFSELAHLDTKDKWQKVEQNMKTNDIDSLGISHSSCFVFDKNNIGNIDDYRKKSVCFNGKFQHEYFLEYLSAHLNEVDKQKLSKPVFAFTSLNLGQEESGRHVQTLDKSLARFVKAMAADKNTVTFLISDHGNTFENFPVQTTEGQYEQYNPFLFMILPTFVARIFGDSKRTNLLNNQLRLISVSDVHDTVMSLIKNSEELNVTHDQGIFQEIDFDRNCEHLGLSSSSLCICDGWSSKQNPNVIHYVIAEFAIGQLNNMIATQYRNQNFGDKELPFVSCERLYGLHLTNISQKRIESGYIITQMDIHVQKKEIFAVQVKWHGDDNPAMGMALVHYRRKQGNGRPTSSCTTYVDQDLCICKHGSQGQNTKVQSNWKRYSNVFGRKTKAENRHKHCLYLLTRDYGVSTVFEAANLCNDIEYHLRMDFELEEMRTPLEIPLNVTIGPKYVYFLTFVTPLHLTNPGTWEFEIAFKAIKLKF